MRWVIGAMLCATVAVCVAACSGSGESAGGAGGDVAAAPQAAAGGGATRAAAREANTSRLAPQLIMTGSLSVTVRSVNTAAARAESVAAAAGGRTDADDRDAPRGSRPSASLTLRVPDAAVPATLSTLAGLGHETFRHLSTRDVTTDVADVASRVISARSSITSLRALYARATKVSDVIRIESSLSQREAALESLEARQRSLSGQVALATITLDLTQHKAAAATHHSARTGFVGGLENGWHAFTTTLGGLAIALGAVLPFAVVLLVLGAGGFGVRRRLRPRRAPAASGE